MADIFHQIRVSASAADVFRAVSARAAHGGIWVAEPDAKMRVVVRDGERKIEWCCVEGPYEWIGTHIAFDLTEKNGTTTVRFSHTQWREASDFLADCTTMWGCFLIGLKANLETAEPDDLVV